MPDFSHPYIPALGVLTKISNQAMNLWNDWNAGDLKGRLNDSYHQFNMCWLCHHCTGWNPILDYRPHVTIRAPPRIPWFLIISLINCHIPGKTHFQTHIQISDCWLYLLLNPHIPLIYININIQFFFPFKPLMYPIHPHMPLNPDWSPIDSWYPSQPSPSRPLRSEKPANGALFLRRTDLLGRIFLAIWATNNRWTRGDILGDEWEMNGIFRNLIDSGCLWSFITIFF